MRLAPALLLLALVRIALGQPAIVTVQLETNRVEIGASTSLHVFAQIAPEYRGGYTRIFSWNVDALLTNGAFARFDPSTLIRPTSDNDPQTSSSGTADGSNLRGIHDSFLNTTNAGRDAPIELFSVPILALAPGRVTLSIQPSSLSDEPDFVVDPIGDGPTLTGANYQAAQIQLEIVAPLTNFVASISQTVLPANAGRLLTISFPAVAPYTYSVESSTNLASPVIWQPLPGAPHNEGFVDDTNTPPVRFYRVRATP